MSTSTVASLRRLSWFAEYVVTADSCRDAHFLWPDVYSYGCGSIVHLRHFSPPLTLQQGPHV